MSIVFFLFLFLLVLGDSKILELEFAYLCNFILFSFVFSFVK